MRGQKGNVIKGSFGYNLSSYFVKEYCDGSFGNNS